MRKFRSLVREGRAEEGPPSVAAATLKDKPNKEPMPKLKEENDTTEKKEMAQTQLHFIHYAAEEILEFIDEGGEIEEWYQNKLSKVHSDMESLHSYMEGESRRTGMKEEVGTLERLRQGAQSYRARTPQGRFTKPKYQGQTHDKDPHGGGIFAKTKPMKTEEVELDEAMAQPDYSQSIKSRQAKADRDNAPFDADKKPVTRATPGKKGLGASTAKHLAKMAMQRQMKKEEVEQIDEISSELAGKVSDARFKRVMSMDRNDPKKPEASAKFSRSSEAARKRITRDMIKDPEKANKGFASDADKNTKRGWSNESVEQIDELSKKTLGNYVKSASHDVAAKAAATRQHSVDAHRKSTEGDFTGARDSMKKSDKSFSDSWKRRNNMAKAVDRLTKEDVEQLDEKNKPTNPELWSRAVAQAKAKFDVYPSAYANGWAAKWYKEKGGGWKSVNEAEERATEPFLKTSGKTKIVKDAAKKKASADKFEADPILSSTVTRNN